ncbi:hypothetical protein E0K89_011715 [Aquicoccus sp. SCR17]|nr:hypothetical protein [Carideicomes alvinocaridis]
MAEIDELQQRIAGALDRIGRGLGALDVAGPDRSGDIYALEAEIKATRAALEDERTANAQLEERVRSIRARHEEKLAEMQAQTEQAARALETLDGELQKLRAINDELRRSNTALREANAEGLGAPDLINASLQTELEALRADRAAESAEARAVLDALEPLLEAAQQDGSREGRA